MRKRRLYFAALVLLGGERVERLRREQRPGNRSGAHYARQR